MGREGRLVLAAENRSSVARKPAKYDISCINYIPLTRNVVRGRSKGTHGKLAFVLDYFFIRSAPQAAEAEGEGYPPLSGGSKSVGPYRLWALIDLAFSAEYEESSETFGKPSVMCDGNYCAFIDGKSAF